MRGLAVFRIVLGAAAWVAPRGLSRLFGVRPERVTPELEYMTRVFGVRAISLGIGYLGSSGGARRLWHRLWILCDAADTAMGVGMVARGRLGGMTAAAGLLTTGGALAIDLAALGESGPEEMLAAAYAAFNRRDLDAAIDLMHPDVDWPNAWEGGRVQGRADVRAYWERQFEEISSRVEPLQVTEEPDGSVTVEVHQVVRDPRSGELLTDTRVRHRYRLDDDLIVRMDVLDS